MSHYHLHGIDGFFPKRSVYSDEFKLNVLSHQDRERLSSRQIAAVYNIRNPNQIVAWRRKLDEGGVQALLRRATLRNAGLDRWYLCFSRTYGE